MRKYLKVNDEAFLDTYINQFKSFLEPGSATYVSAPITTGKDFLNWYNIKGKFSIDNTKAYKLIHHSDVISINIARIKLFAHDLRQQENEIFIEPASYENDSWSQHDYLYYWTGIISKYVRKIICMDGWEYSRGCVFEYLCGRKLGLQFERQDRQKLFPESGLDLINSAIKELSNLEFFDLQMHLDVYNELMYLK